MRCKGCHYSLLNLTEPRCPECGRAFDPNNAATYETLEARDLRTARREIMWVLAGFIALWVPLSIAMRGEVVLSFACAVVVISFLAIVVVALLSIFRSIRS